MFQNVKEGDIVTRNLAGTMMKMRVTKVDAKLIYCSTKGTSGPFAGTIIDGWTFDRETGAEIDEELGWGNHGTGSYLVKVEGEANG